MDYDHLSPTGSRSPLASSNSSSLGRNPTPATADDDLHVQKPPRACEYCRQHKVRCDIDLRDPSGSCGRCQKASRECVSTLHSRKRRKTTDSRVLDLERKVERLGSRLDELERKGGSGGEEGHKQVGISPAVFVQPPHPNSSPTQQDVIDRQFLSVEFADRIFQHYVTEMSPIIPAVVFPPNTLSSDIRRYRPILFLSVLAAASGEFDNSLQKKLHSELLTCLSNLIMHRGMKSLELIQALTITVIWHRPPEDAGGGNLNQFVYMTAVMASDISITRCNSKRRHPASSDPEANAKVEQQWDDTFPTGAGWRFMIWGVNPDSSLPESRRALLSCYFMCSNIARLTRRPNVFPYTSYIQECMKFLETSNEPGVFASDRNLVQWIRVSRMTEEFGVVPPPGESIGGLSASEHHAEIALQGFLERMAEWRRMAGTITPALDLFAHGMTKHMYDLILHPEHIAEEFRPFSFQVLVEHAQAEPNKRPPTKFRATAVRECLTAVHSCLEGLLAFSPDFVRSLPALFYTETGYTIGVLTKMFFAAALSSPISRILDVAEVKFSEYVDRFIAFLGAVTTQDRRYIAQRLRSIISGLKAFVDKHKQKAFEASALAPPQQFERSAPCSLPPSPQQCLPSVDAVMHTGMSFVGYSSVDGVHGASSLQGIGVVDPMMWDSFPLTEFLQLDGAPDLYPPWI